MKKNLPCMSGNDTRIQEQFVVNLWWWRRTFCVLCHRFSEIKVLLKMIYLSVIHLFNQPTQSYSILLQYGKDGNDQIKVSNFQQIYTFNYLGKNHLSSNNQNNLSSIVELEDHISPNLMWNSKPRRSSCLLFFPCLYLAGSVNIVKQTAIRRRLN